MPFLTGTMVMAVALMAIAGLSATALFARAFGEAGWTVRTRIVGRGESPWSDAMRTELADKPAGGVIITDLGVRDALPKPGVPTVVVDHHVPGVPPAGATVISGHGQDPIPTSSLLAFWCAGALALLMKADGSKDVLSSHWPEAALVLAARAEVKRELEAARRVGPVMRGEVALIRFASPTQIHPLIAQQWRGRLRDKIVMAANTGYRPGWVHFAVRSGEDRDLVGFLAEHRPPGADEMYGAGHRQATGGALRPADWNAFITGLGFGPGATVPDKAAPEIAA